MSVIESEIKVGDYIILLPQKPTSSHYFGVCGQVIRIGTTPQGWLWARRLTKETPFTSAEFCFNNEQAFKVITKEQAENPNFAAWIKASYNNGN